MNHIVKILRLTDFDEEGGCILYFTCKINNKKANLIIDTGASRTCIDEKSYYKFIGNNKENIIQKDIKTAGIGTNKMTSKLTQINIIKINKLSINNCKVFITDLSNVNAVFNDKISIDGILGNDFLVQYNAIIDYYKNTLKLRDSTNTNK